MIPCYRTTPAAGSSVLGIIILALPGFFVVCLALRLAVRRLQLFSQRSPPARQPDPAQIPLTNTHNRVLHSVPSTPAQAYYHDPLHAGVLAVAPPESIIFLALPSHSFGQALESGP